MIIVFGISSYGSLDQELTPEMNTPVLMVMTMYSDANPEDVEELVTSKIEAQVSTLSDVKQVTTSSAEGQSMVMVQYEYGIDIDEAYDELKKKVESAERQLPDSAPGTVYYGNEHGAGGHFAAIGQRRSNRRFI